jgi:GAF domain-containing protein
LAVVSGSGETLEANSAFRDLAAAGGSRDLEVLFGPSVRELLAEALRTGAARAFLPLSTAAEPRPWFRLSLAADPNREEVTVLATAMCEEMGWRRELDERGREIEMLRNVGAALSGAVELDSLAERIYQQTTLITQAGNFYIALWDRDAGIVSFPRYVEDGAWQEMRSRRESNGLTEHVLRTGQPLLLNRDVLERSRALGIEPIGRDCCAWLGVPMTYDGEVIGMIGLQDYDRNDVYDDHDLELLSIIAAQAAAAIKTTRLLASARRAYQELSQTQVRLLETERVRGVTETVGALNHEINNPLAVIAGNAQLLLRRSDTLPAEVRAKIETILDSANRIQRVTTKMATLIQATSMPYPGESAILDVGRSVAVGEASPRRTLPDDRDERKAA